MLGEGGGMKKSSSKKRVMCKNDGLVSSDGDEVVVVASQVPKKDSEQLQCIEDISKHPENFEFFML